MVPVITEKILYEHVYNFEKTVLAEYFSLLYSKVYLPILCIASESGYSSKDALLDKYIRASVNVFWRFFKIFVRLFLNIIIYF